MKLKDFLQKVPFSALSLVCLCITYFVAGTIGMLVVPVILCIIFVLPFGVLFAILDIVIRKKKVLPIICLIASLYPIIGFGFMICSIIFTTISDILQGGISA